MVLFFFFFFPPHLIQLGSPIGVIQGRMCEIPPPFCSFKCSHNFPFSSCRLCAASPFSFVQSSHCESAVSISFFLPLSILVVVHIKARCCLFLLSKGTAVLAPCIGSGIFVSVSHCPTFFSCATKVRITNAVFSFVSAPRDGGGPPIWGSAFTVQKIFFFFAPPEAACTEVDA